MTRRVWHVYGGSSASGVAFPGFAEALPILLAIFEVTDVDVKTIV
jgi:hypothetical protein